jgi:hypothetical protein
MSKNKILPLWSELALSVSLLATVGTFCYAIIPGTRAAQAASKSDVAFWHSVSVHGDEVEGYASLEDMGAAADLVGRGHFENFRVTRKIQGDAAEDIVAYMGADFVPVEWIAGRTDGRVVVEFALPFQVDDPSSAIAELSLGVGKADSVVALRRKTGRGETNFYRLVNSHGLFVEDGGKVATPLADEETESVHPTQPSTSHKRPTEEEQRLLRPAEFRDRPKPSSPPAPHVQPPQGAVTELSIDAKFEKQVTGTAFSDLARHLKK